ncbi:acyltransferase [Mesobacillus jeotgali]|uniref:acyltransferase n=1 Tax=Mesobacillus jeotgali TaxID=129985 RepID=UPI001CFE047A|nr:acyltransferase family protein [Mesobacillus jeotgali]
MFLIYNSKGQNSYVSQYFEMTRGISNGFYGLFGMRERVIFFDWLRIFATIAVVTIHVSAEPVWVNMYEAPRFYWLSANFYESLTRASVPLFVMISGALMLGKGKAISYRNFLSTKVNKIFLPLLLWSLIYYIYHVYRGDHEGFQILHFIKLFLTNGVSVHFWFMYMILGIYLTVPIIRIFIQNASKKDIEYFLILWLYASVIVKYMKFHNGFSFNLELYLVTNYIGYFILGYYLTNYSLAKKWRLLTYSGGLAGIVSTFLLTYLDTKEAGGALQAFWYEYHSPNVLLSSIGIFVLAKYSIKRGLPSFINEINKVSFGIYLVHMLVLDVFANEIFDRLQHNLHPLLSIPLIVLIAVIFSAIVTYTLSRIPILKRLVP